MFRKMNEINKKYQNVITRNFIVIIVLCKGQFHQKPKKRRLF